MYIIVRDTGAFHSEFFGLAMVIAASHLEIGGVCECDLALGLGLFGLLLVRLQLHTAVERLRGIAMPPQCLRPPPAIMSAA